MKKINSIFCVILVLAPVCMAAYEDARCKCVCVDKTGEYNGTKPIRNIYIAAVAADKCVCKLILGKDADLCPYCDCKYQVRNTTIIKVVVCLILAVVSALTLYMLFLLLLEPLLSARRAGRKLLSVPADPSTCAGTAPELSPGTVTYIHSRKSFVANAEVPWIRAGSSGSQTAPKGSSVAVAWSRKKPEAGELVSMQQARSNESPDKPHLRQRSGKPDLLILPPATSSRIPPTSGVAAAAGVSTMVKSVRDQQQRWKGNVEAQRARVFSEHTLLN